MKLLLAHEYFKGLEGRWLREKKKYGWGYCPFTEARRFDDTTGFFLPCSKNLIIYA
jgi:hypothetical protein